MLYKYIYIYLYIYTYIYFSILFFLYICITYFCCKQSYLFSFLLIKLLLWVFFGEEQPSRDACPLVFACRTRCLVRRAGIKRPPFCFRDSSRAPIGSNRRPMAACVGRASRTRFYIVAPKPMGERCSPPSLLPVPLSSAGGDRGRVSVWTYEPRFTWSLNFYDGVCHTFNCTLQSAV